MSHGTHPAASGHHTPTSPLRDLAPGNPAGAEHESGNTIVMDLTDRHPGTQEVGRRFNYDHLPAHLQAFSKPAHDLAEHMIRISGDGPELTWGLRALLTAKDAFVRVGCDVAAAVPAPSTPTA